MELIPEATTAQPQNPPVIEVQNVSKWYDGPKKGEKIHIVDNINFTVPDIEAGEFLAILGPSGCGKSTVMNMLAGLTKPDTGTVKTFGFEVKGDNPEAVTVQQAYTCFDWLTVQGNVELGLEVAGIKQPQRAELAQDFIAKVGLAGREGAYPRELSGGMKQRVALARALVLRPRLVLMDEPFGALDAQIRAEMQQLLLSLWEEQKNTIFFITHDITEALLLADRIIVLAPRPTKVVYDYHVPFARPRVETLALDDAFVAASQELLKILKEAQGSGQVRVSV